MTVTDSTPATVSTQAPAPDTASSAPGDREMTMLEHLDELRQRLVVSVMSVIVGMVVAVVPVPGFDSLTHFIIGKLVERAPGGTVQVIRPGEGFFTFLQVAMVVGVAVAMPVIVYQVLAFVSPALYPREKRYLYLAAPGVTISFAIGAYFCYQFMLPVAIQFLGGFATDIFTPQWTAEHYLDFVTNFVFWVGVTFELPIVMYFLSKLGVVTPQRMARFRKYAFVMAFVIGALITPTPDPVNQSMVSLPIYLLFEFGIILARFA